jgi:tetratricopeptide (TPR) repeat protein
MFKGFYLLIPLMPTLLFTTDWLIARNSVQQGYSVHPQQGNSGNLLDILAGDARDLISQAMISKAESYYHGGLTDHEDCQASTGGCQHDEEDHDQHLHQKPFLSSFDPWGYINKHIHAEAHIHLERDKTEELLPWYWAACEASPHNILAFEATSYALSTMLDQPQEAVLLLESGIQKNPYNVSLEIGRGEILIKHLKNFKEAEAAFLSAYQKSLHEKAPADDMLKAKALFYLGYLAKRRNDLATLHRWQTIGKETMSPDIVSIRDLLKLE